MYQAIYTPTTYPVVNNLCAFTFTSLIILIPTKLYQYSIYSYILIPYIPVRETSHQPHLLLTFYCIYPGKTWPSWENGLGLVVTVFYINITGIDHMFDIWYFNISISYYILNNFPRAENRNPFGLCYICSGAWKPTGVLHFSYYILIWAYDHIYHINTIPVGIDINTGTYSIQYT